MKTLVRITTVPISLDKLIEGQMRFMSTYFKVIGVSSNKEELQKVGQKQNVETFTVNMTRKITPLQDLKAVYTFYKYLKQTKPDIVHSHTPKAGIVGMLASYFAKVPVRLHTVAGLPLVESKGLKKNILKVVETITYKCATKVYPNSYGLKQIILDEKLAKKNQLKVIANGSSNGINLSHFNRNQLNESDLNQLKKSLNIAENDFVYVFVGRLVGDKGINELIASFKKLSKIKKDIKLLLVGTLETELDPLKPETLQEIKTNKNIISVGFQQDVRSYFAISNLLVFPSYREGFPNVVMQAGALELPSIVSNINGCNEIITENKNGYIVPVKDDKALYYSMLKCLENQAETLQLAQNARAVLLEKYDKKVIWEALLSEYNDHLKDIKSDL